MGAFLLMFLLVFAVSVGGFIFMSKTARGQDLDKMKGRLLGRDKAKKKTKSTGHAALINTPAAGQELALRMLKKYKLNDKLQAFIEQAGLKWNVARLVHSSMALFLLTYSIGWLMLPAQFQSVLLLVALGASTLPFMVLMRKRNARLAKFEEQFPESLEFVARSMRAGHAFSVSLEMIHKEFAEPLGGEFRRAFEEHNLGLPLEIALEKLVKRVPSLDVQFFVSAVILQKRTGGNLAEILDKLAFIMRERFKLRGKIRAISAHGRMTGIALSCIPLGVGVLMFYTNPDYVKFFFTDDVGNIMMGVAVVLQVLGYLIMMQIVKIEV